LIALFKGGAAQVFREEHVLEKLSSRVPALQREKQRMAELPHVGDVRGMGMAAAFELVADKKTKEPFASEMRVGWQVYLKGLENGLILRPLGDVTYLFLPLCTRIDQMEDIIERTEKTLFQVLSRL
jgi:adenosylmethionine-8-amino-7-oxononanoate aminotransferase